MARRTQSQYENDTGNSRVSTTVPTETAKIIEQTAIKEQRSISSVASIILTDWANGHEPSIKPTSTEGN